VAFVTASLFGGSLADALPAEMGTVELRLLAGYAGLFLLVLVLMSVVAVVSWSRPPDWGSRTGCWASCSVRRVACWW
jgi:hypothetical protein